MRGLSLERRKLRLLPYLAAAIAIVSLGMTGMARANDDGYAMTGVVNVPSHAITCTFPYNDPASSPATNTNTTDFSFDISWVAQARGEYLLADRSHGRPEPYNTEGGMLSNATSGDIMVIKTDNPDDVSYILPPRNDPFAGHRCDDNANFGGLISRNEIEGPNGVFTVNDTQAWVGDGPSDFTPGQNNMLSGGKASDYNNDPCDSSVRVFSLITHRQIDHINVHGCFRTDEGAFDPVDQIALFANPSEKPLPGNPRATALNNSPFITLISTRPGHGDRHHHWGDDGHRDGRYEILKQIDFNGNHGTPNANGGIEQAVYSRQTGLFYIAVPGNSTNPDGFVTTVDPRHHHHFEVASYALASGSCDGGPAGAALGPNHELLLGCGNFANTKGEVVVDITKLSASSTTPGSAADPFFLNDSSASCDEVAYDAGSGHFAGACFTKSPAGFFRPLISDARSLQFEGLIPGTGLGHGAFGAHSIAADSTNENFWMPMYQGDCGANQACVAVYGATNPDDFGDSPPSP